MIKESFRENDFARWREENETEYLKEKRAWEKENKKYAKPYLEYLDHKEDELFSQFWETYRFPLAQYFLAGTQAKSGEQLPNEYKNYLKRWREELNVGAHHALDWYNHYHRLKKMMEAIPVEMHQSFLKALRSYQEMNKTLRGKYRGLRGGGKKKKGLPSLFILKTALGMVGHNVIVNRHTKGRFLNW